MFTLMYTIRRAYAIYKTWGGTMSRQAFAHCFRQARIGVEKCMHLDNFNPDSLVEHPETQKLIDEDDLDPVVLLLLPDVTLIAEGEHRFAAAYASNRVVAALMVCLDS
jgi:hypothetical protein